MILKKPLKYLVLTLFITNHVYIWMDYSQFGLSFGLTEYKEAFLYILLKNIDLMCTNTNMLFFFLSVSFLILPILILTIKKVI